MGTEIKIRVATADDAKAILNIYQYYVKHTAISFEYIPPTVEEFQDRINTILQKYPYVLAEMEGEIVGYAYAGTFIGRAACDWSVELSVYVAKQARRCGVGGMLYRVIEQILAEMHIVNVNACIAVPDVEDEYLNNNSIQFHEHMGYQYVGKFHKCGYKFGRWYNLVWMEKMLGDHLIPQPIALRFDQVREIVQEKYEIS